MAEGYQNAEILEYARDLALRDYDIVVSSEVGVGGKIIYTARTPELGTCKAQGHSVIEAVKNLIDARIDYIYACLVVGYTVAPPNAEKTGETAYVQESEVVCYTQNADSFVIEIAPQPITFKSYIGAVIHRIRATIPHLEIYADWDALWVALLNDDVEEFDILDSRHQKPICHIRKADGEWSLLFTNNDYDSMRGRVINSKPKLFAYIGYLAGARIERVKCLPKKVSR